jgi:hypothetical protein
MGPKMVPAKMVPENGARPQFLKLGPGTIFCFIVVVRFTYIRIIHSYRFNSSSS